ncbi:hypothetical protein [Paenibacillus brasilensis]|uniref:Uncharacterized protein n=1 Tax=Paenibacillus brasilensis TaxID=128574 RepID=A0ABU0L6D2_9BACL|nr:hypothetical protein [Paenibacillus brasilensis]MDQ0496857.1 hypothetical protein [Paenibacillus brasilensis]
MKTEYGKAARRKRLRTALFFFFEFSRKGLCFEGFTLIGFGTMKEWSEAQWSHGSPWLRST